MATAWTVSSTVQSSARRVSCWPDWPVWLGSGDQANFSERLGVNFQRETPWSARIDRAAQYGNQTLVALLAGVGMQGSGWDRMTARHLFHIVRALDRVGLNAEARMIAAEAVARG
jgi:hypothetical protein